MRNMERIPVIFITVLVLAGCSSEQHPARTNMGIAKGCEASSVTLTASVTDYGAVGDGDGSKAVANAIAFSNAIADLSAKGGGELFIPDGTYMLAPDTENSVIVRLKSHIHVRCESHNAILKSNGQLPMNVRMMGLADIQGASLTDVVIDGCGFDGSDTAPDGSGTQQAHAIMLNTADPDSITNVTITNNFIKDFPADGIQLSSNSSSICVTNNHIQNVGRAGIGAGSGGSSKRGEYYITGNEVIPTATYANTRGIDLESVNDMNDVLIDNNILNEIQIASGVSSTTGRWIITNNQMTAGGLSIGGTNDVFVANNAITQTQNNPGIIVEQRAYGITIANNNITTMPDVYGIMISPADTTS